MKTRAGASGQLSLLPLPVSIPPEGCPDCGVPPVPTGSGVGMDPWLCTGSRTAPSVPGTAPSVPGTAPGTQTPPEHPKIPPLPWDLPSGRGIWTPRRSWRSFPGEETLGLLRALPAHSGGAEALLGTRTPCGPPQHAGDARSHQRAPEVPRARTRREKTSRQSLRTEIFFFPPRPRHFC